jgi:hypothetical protein
MALTFRKFTGGPIGPFFLANSMEIIIKDNQQYTLTIFPDLFNEELRAAGKPLHFYYLPDRIRLAQFPDGSFKMHFTEFAGVLNPDRNIAVKEGQLEAAGGLLNFTATLGVPEKILLQAKEQLKQKITAEAQWKMDSLWKLIAGQPAPELGAVPIIANNVAITSVSPEDVTDPTNHKPDNPWLYKVEGNGKGNISPTGENAYSVMLGMFPSQIVKAGFMGKGANVNVMSNAKFKFWTTPFFAEVKGSWENIHNHFSTALAGKSWFAKVDIQAAFNNAVQKGVITQKIVVDTTVVSQETRDKYEAQVQKVFDKFMEQAEKAIFNKEYKEPEPAKAQAGGGWFGWGGGFSMKIQRDSQHLDLFWSMEVDEPYLLESTISSTLEGVYDQAKKDKKVLAKYFSTVYLDEGFQKIHVVATSNARWFSENPNIPAQPISRMGIEIGYPDSKGVVRWQNSGRFLDPGGTEVSKNFVSALWDKNAPDRQFIFEFQKMKKDQMPANFNPNKIYVKKHLYFKIDPRIEVKAPDIILQQETDSNTINISLNNLDTYQVRFINGTSLTAANQQVNIIIKKDNRVETKVFNLANTDSTQIFEGYLLKNNKGSALIPFQYKVEVLIKGKFPKPTLRWTTDWISAEVSVNSEGTDITIPIPEVPENLVDKVNEYMSEA